MHSNDLYVSQIKISLVSSNKTDNYVLMPKFNLIKNFYIHETIYEDSVPGIVLMTFL